MNDKLDKILDLLRSQNEMIKDIHDYMIGSKRLIRDAQAIRLVLIMNMVMIILKTEKDA